MTATNVGKSPPSVNAVPLQAEELVESEEEPLQRNGRAGHENGISETQQKGIENVSAEGETKEMPEDEAAPNPRPKPKEMQISAELEQDNGSQKKKKKKNKKKK